MLIASIILNVASNDIFLSVSHSPSSAKFAHCACLWRLLADSIACQLFGCFITAASWSDSWALYGVSKYLSEEYARETFGTNEYFYTVRHAIREVRFQTMDRMCFTFCRSLIVNSNNTLIGNNSSFILNENEIKLDYRKLNQKKGQRKSSPALQAFPLRINFSGK